MYSNGHVILVCRLPVVDIEVPTYELPLPEGVGEEILHQDNMSLCQIEETWREPLLESDLHSDLREWISNHLAADWTTVTQLRMEESKRDPPEEPFRSLYIARELLSGDDSCLNCSSSV